MEIECGEKINDQNETATKKVNIKIKDVIKSELKGKSDETMHTSTSGNESSDFSLNLSTTDNDTTPPVNMNDSGTGSSENNENNISETIKKRGKKIIESDKSVENYESRKLDDDDDDEGPTESDDLLSPGEIESEEDSPDDDEDDLEEPDVAIILGSSDGEDDEEEEEERDDDEDDAPNEQRNSINYQELIISSDEEQNAYFDEYDADDDLMDSVVMSSRKIEKDIRKSRESHSKNEKKEAEKLRKRKIAFRKIPKIYDYRLQAKKKSVKRLTNRFAHHHQNSPSSSFTAKTENSRSSAKTEDGKILYPVDAYSDFSTSKMQQVDKIRDCIQNVEDIKQQHPKGLHDDQNKENVDNNEKLLSSSASIKLNGNAEEINKNEETKNSISEQQKNDEKDSNETSTTTVDQSKSLEQITAIDTTNVTTIEVNDDTVKNKVEKSIEDCEIKKENSEKSVEENAKEAVPKNVSDSVSCNKTSLETKTNIKDIQQTDLKKLSSSSAKRTRSPCLDDTNLEDLHPTKKLRVELEANFQTHNRILNEYIEKTSNNSIEDIQKHINQLIIEIQTINEMMKAKEIEWNNMLHLKKVKEEICFRITRKKQVMEIMATKVGETNFPGRGCTDIDNPNESIIQNSKHPKMYSSTPTTIPGGGVYSDNLNISVLNSVSNTNVTPISSNIQSNSNVGDTAQSILQNRANMKSSDLAKEKATTQRLHRLLVSRNILPKPSSSPGSLGFNSSTAASVAFSTAATSSASTVLSNLPLTLSNALTGSSLSAQQPILNSYLSAASTVQQQLGEMLNGHHHSQIGQQNCNTNGGQTLMVGRQGVFKDVKSIIAEYKQRHPEVVPRRGRRVKSNPSATDSGSILGNALKSDGKMSTDLGLLLAKFDGNSRPSSNDSSHSMTNLIGTSSGNANLGNVSFKDVLVQFAKMSGQTERLGTSGPVKLQHTSTGNTSQGVPPPYPEVTLHPVSTTQSNTEPGTAPLLHGILTKFLRESATRTTSSAAPTSTTQTPTSQNYSSSFSPTLARLLTAPERITPVHNQPTINSYPSGLQSSHSSVTGSGLNLSKVVGHNSEITITPVVSSQTNSQNLLQHSNIRDEEADDSVDRLVIDEGGDSSGADGATRIGRIAPHAIGQVFGEHEVPACQGCKKQEAQFVCAGCGNQWYCSRECQVASWDEHSEVCTG